MADTEPLPDQSGGAEVDRDRTGSVVGGKYRVHALLGAGGMGSVYDASNTWTKRRVAIKFLRPDLSLSRESVLRFMQEAQSAASILHPNIVDVLDMGRDATDGALYIVQEFLAGQNLRQRIGKHQSGNGIPVAEAIDIALPIMGALCSAHERGIVHRDIKPENIFLTTGPGGERVPKLIDFGVSKVHGSAGVAEQTAAGSFVGTPRYMSPEQLRSDRAIDGRADVWSMAVVIYEMLTGRCPYIGDNMFSLVSSILKGRPAPVDQLSPACPPALAQVVAKALEPKLEERYADMRSFVDAILVCPGLEDPKAPVKLAERHRAALNPVTPVHEGRPPIEDEGSAFPTELFTPMATPPPGSVSTDAGRLPRDASPTTVNLGPGGGSPAHLASGSSLTTGSGVMNGELSAQAAAAAKSGSQRWVVVSIIAVLALVAGAVGARSFLPWASGPGAAPPAKSAATTAPTAPAATPAAAPPAPADAGAPSAATPGPADASGGAGGRADGGAAADAGAAPAQVAEPHAPAVKKHPHHRPPKAAKVKGKAKRHVGDTYVLEPD
jgi:serine/threonine-protein kinase